MSDENKIAILLVDDEIINLENVGHFLSRKGFTVTTAASGEKAIELLQHSHFDLVVTDFKMHDIDGVQVMKTAKKLHPEIEVIIVTGYATVNSAVDAMAQGAFYYLSKPIKLKELLTLVTRATEKTLLRWEISRLKQRINSQKETTQFIGQNPEILKLKDSIAHFSQLDCNILITGDTGTGKELVAKIIYELSPRANRRFLPLNCGAMTEELMQNELFGHEKDAYTDAGSMRRGLLESANGGVILFDEIGEMPLSMQVRLLRVLQDRKIIRVGGTEEISIDVRILAATHRNLKEEVEKGTFRQDLFYRLNVVHLHIPPLRERKDDIPLLVNYFLAKFAPSDGIIKGISPEALLRLQEHDFPGNARELENTIERSLALCDESEIKVHHLPSDISQAVQVSKPSFYATKPNKSLEENEREYILSVLKSADGNKTKAAKIIGIDRVSLWRKLKKYNKLSSNR